MSELRSGEAKVPMNGTEVSWLREGFQAFLRE